MQNLKPFLTAGLSSISNYFRRNPGLVKKFVLVVVGVLTLVMILRYINQYLYKSKAGVDEVNVTMTPSKTNVAPGEEFTITVPVSAESSKKISGVDIKVKFDADNGDKVDYKGYSISPNTTYFNDRLQESTEIVDNAKLLHLTLIANKPDTELTSNVLVVLKFQAKPAANGTVQFLVVASGTQIVGTATDNSFTLPSTDIATSVTIGSGEPGSPTPPIMCIDNTQCPAGYNCVDGTCQADEDTPPPNGVLLSFSKIKLQGVVRKPADDLSTIPVKVTLKGARGTFPISVTTNFGVNSGAEWSGSVVLPNVPSGTYTIFVKGRKHLQRKVCFATRQAPTATQIPTPPYGEDYPPNEEPDPDPNCVNDKIALQGGKRYEIQMSAKERVHLFAGDLPIGGAQDGVIDSLDLIYLRNRVGMRDEEYLKVGDLNLDKFINAQDHSLPIAVLNLEMNEDEE